MLSKPELRQLLKDNLSDIVEKMNVALKGEQLEELEPVLKRIGHGGHIPHWFEGLQTKKSLPNLDGKTIGSVVEMLLVAVLETSTFETLDAPNLRLNPARGVDLPDLDLSIKSPSENYCTSEPFFSAYERLIGSDHDAVILLTDYQSAKKSPPLKLQIINSRYLTNTQIADAKLCEIAKEIREWLLEEDEIWMKKVARFLAFVNQSDWRAKQILRLLPVMQDEQAVTRTIRTAAKDFTMKNEKKAKEDKEPIPDSDLDSLTRIETVKPIHLGVIDCADNWVLEAQKDLGRIVNDNEWQRFIGSPLDGKIGMSFALQWRYNFGKLFGASSELEKDNNEGSGIGT